MQLIKNNFSISDLENLSGIKAHTIRIWEKRYGLLSPERTKTNIRTYSLESLKKILNVSLLNSNGFKISKIAQLSDLDFKQAIAGLIDQHLRSDYYIQELLVAMFAFDRDHFIYINAELKEHKGFEQRFEECYMPLLMRIGLLWQSGVITPSHEHFIAVLIKEQLLLELEGLHSTANSSDETYILFLPDGELHDLGIYYIYYLLLQQSKKVLYLGASVPLEDLEKLLNLSSKINFVSSFTVAPEANSINEYLQKVHDTLLNSSSNHFYAWGSVLDSVDERPSKQMTIASNLLEIKDFLLP